MTDLLLAYYGDDFTGSADVLEALARAGYRAALFLQPPTPAQLARYPGLRAFGIAGGSRTMSPEEMERELPPAFEALKASGARIAHYKMCSTFDSSPGLGSIGKAIELGRRVFGERPTFLAVGLPLLGRYVVFGNLFARSGLESEPCRLDRHPTMSRHPVTPMNESDLRLILGAQTKLPVQLIDVLELETALSCGAGLAALEPASIVLFDTLREAHLPLIGREIDRWAEAGQIFVAGSSAVEYALAAHWHKAVSSETLSSPPASSQLIVVSGSCSPVTSRQIAAAVGAGFAEIALDPIRLIHPAGETAETAKALAILASGSSLVLHTNCGPEDQRFQKSLSPAGRERLGRALGAVLDQLLHDSGLKRAVVCGGDTSMAVARALGIEALEYAAPAAPGSPLCRAHAPGRAADGREFVFKGGQNGRDRILLDLLELPSPVNQ